MRWIAWGMLATLGCLLAGSTPTVAQPAPPESRGFLYGRVTTDSGRDYTGFLRWSDEEACWDDLFHSSKEDLPYFDEVDDADWRRHQGERRGRVRVFVWTIRWESDEYDERGRIFASRFGDIASIEVTGDEDACVRMKTGERYDVSGYANDVGGTIHVTDASLGEIDLHWDRIESIEFEPVPHGADPGVWRLHGTVDTDSGEFQGFIQWDKEECLNTDLLDGDTRDGDVSVPMGRIQSIERRGRSSAVVELRDGRSLRLRGTNDVNSENRGIMVEDPRYGRVTIPWNEFNRVTFDEAGESGRAYGDFPPLGFLQGTVTDTDGAQHHGRLVFDLDESEGWEMLNGEHNDIEFDIPLARVRAIEPRRYDECLVELRNGERLILEESQDVGENNDGILIYVVEDEDPVYLPWLEVERIVFD